MSKAKIVEKKSQNSVKYERELLSKIRHPFIVNMIFCFQDRENLYLVMDMLTGGDLRYHVSRNKRFSEEQTKFFVACILLALDYLHINNILHRDIKPENLVLDEKGNYPNKILNLPILYIIDTFYLLIICYVRLTDFGIAKLFQKENSSETSGTPGYMAPEVMCAQNHTIAVDYFALGVMTYEFMMGKVISHIYIKRPYLGKTRKEIKEHIMSKQVQVTKNDIFEGWTLEAGDFINKV